MRKENVRIIKQLLCLLIVFAMTISGCNKQVHEKEPSGKTDIETAVPDMGKTELPPILASNDVKESLGITEEETQEESLEGKTANEKETQTSEEPVESTIDYTTEGALVITEIYADGSKVVKTTTKDGSVEVKDIDKNGKEVIRPTTKPTTKPEETKPVETKPAETKPAETKPVVEKPVETKPVEKPVVEKPVTPTKPATPTTPTKPATPTKPTNPTLAKPNVDEPAKKTLVSLVYAQTKPLDHCKQIPDTSYVSATATFSDGSKKQATVLSIYLSTIKGDAHTYSVKASLDGSEHSGVVTLQREPFNEEAYKGILTLSTNKKAANGKRKLTGADLDAYSKLFWSVQAEHNCFVLQQDIDYFLKEGDRITCELEDYTLEELYEIAYAGLQRMREKHNVPAFKSRHPVLMKQAQDHANTIAALPNYCNVTIMGQGAKFHTNHYYDGVTYNALVNERINAGLSSWTEMLSPESNVFGIYLTCERGIQDHCPKSTRADMTDIGIGITKITHNTFDKNSPTDHLMVIQVMGRAD